MPTPLFEKIYSFTKESLQTTTPINKIVFKEGFMKKLFPTHLTVGEQKLLQNNRQQ